MWIVTVMGDAGPYYIFDNGVLNQFLSTLSGKVVSVQAYDVLLKSTTVYGMANDPALPSASSPPLSIVQYQQNCYKRA